MGTVTQSVQRELNPHVYHGKVAGFRYIMDANGPRASRSSHELPESNRLLQNDDLVLNPISGLYAAFVGHGCQFRRLDLNQ